MKMKKREFQRIEAWSKAQADAASNASPEANVLSQWLAKHGFSPIDVNAAGDHAITPLMRASKIGDIAIMNSLLRAGARLETRNADGCNALWMACVGAATEAIDLLINAGADLKLESLDGFTALDSAATVECLNLLRAAGRKTA